MVGEIAVSEEFHLPGLDGETVQATVLPEHPWPVSDGLFIHDSIGLVDWSIQKGCRSMEPA